MFTAFLRCAEISVTFLLSLCRDFLFTLMKDMGTGSISQQTGILLSKYYRPQSVMHLRCRVWCTVERVVKRKAFSKTWWNMMWD